MKVPKVALVYDRVNKWGGAERLLLSLHALYPDAPLYTSVYNSQKAPWAKVFPRIIPTFLQKMPLSSVFHEIYPWLTEMAFSSLDFSGFDMVISVTSAEAKSIITKPSTLHICYCLTPTRYLWQDYFNYLTNPGLGMFNALAKIIFPLFSLSMRLSDQTAAQRPDFYLTISNSVKKRITKYYRRESEVIFPGVDTGYYTPAENDNSQGEEYFLVVSRLIPNKRIDLVVETFNILGWKLKIIGSGREKKKLQRLARANIEFMGELTDKSVIGYYQGCQALVVAGEEDFGLTSVEVQACGRPVIAFQKGGLTETVREHITGVFFKEQSCTSLTEALQDFKRRQFSSVNCRKQAEEFSETRFRREFTKKVEELWRIWEKTTVTQ